MAVPVTAPSEVVVVSPKSTTTLWMTVPLPATGATDAVNVMSVPAVGVVVAVVMDTTGCGFGLTATEIDILIMLPKPSVTVPTMVYLPDIHITWSYHSVSV